MSSDIGGIIDIVLERLPEIIEKEPERAHKLYVALSKYFVTREEFEKILKRIDSLLEELVKMRKDFEKRFSNIEDRLDGMETRLDKIETRLSRVEKTLEKLTLHIEDDARLTIMEALKEYGIDIDLHCLEFKDREINIYGIHKDICVIGEASVRAGNEIAERLLRDLEYLKNKHPEYLRKNIILVLYVMAPLKELIEKCKKENIWLLKPSKTLVLPDKIKSILKG